jgi:hypothetical protein
MKHSKNDRFYIDELLAKAGEDIVSDGDLLEFEMPSFCSGDYHAVIYFDEQNYPYILKSQNYLEGCRDWSIRRVNKKPHQPTAEKIKERVLSQFSPPSVDEIINQFPSFSKTSPPKPKLESLEQVVEALNKRIPDFLAEKAVVCGLWDSGYMATIDIMGLNLWDSEVSQVLTPLGPDGDFLEATYDDIFDHCLRELKKYAEWFSGIAFANMRSKSFH